MKKKADKISVVIPVYKCGRCLSELVSRLNTSLATIACANEIILVNDACPDGSWQVIKELAGQYDNILGINLSRNFGQHYAITAGLDHVSDADWVVVMDCDLQDRPEEIKKLYNKAVQGYDIVLGKRSQRTDRFLKKLFSKTYYKLFDYLTDQKTDPDVANFGIYSFPVIENFRKFREQNRLYPLFIRWLGFKTAVIDIAHGSRFAGKSAYTFKKSFNLALDNILAHSNKPLKASIKFGFAMSFFSFLSGFYLMVRFFLFTIPVQGWTSVMVSLFFLSGLIMANMGILGLYIGKIFNETKNRPLYIVREFTKKN